MAEEWITTQEAANFSGLSQSHVRYLIRNGLVPGRKLGRDWVTTRRAIEEYLATNPRPGRRPKKGSR
jgi:excisionase family DNA binding protein